MTSGSPPTSGSWAAMPALATTTSSPPSASTAAATAASTSSRSVTSQRVPRRSAAAGGHLREQLGLEPGERHARAALVQALGEGGADAARRAGDQHAPAARGKEPLPAPYRSANTDVHRVMPATRRYRRSARGLRATERGATAMNRTRPRRMPNRRGLPRRARYRPRPMRTRLRIRAAEPRRARARLAPAGCRGRGRWSPPASRAHAASRSRTPPSPARASASRSSAGSGESAAGRARAPAASGRACSQAGSRPMLRGPIGERRDRQTPMPPPSRPAAGQRRGSCPRGARCWSPASSGPRARPAGGCGRTRTSRAGAWAGRSRSRAAGAGGRGRARRRSARSRRRRRRSGPARSAAGSVCGWYGRTGVLLRAIERAVRGAQRALGDDRLAAVGRDVGELGVPVGVGRRRRGDEVQRRSARSGRARCSSAGVRNVRPCGPSSRWSVGTYGVAATVPYWLNARLNPAAGLVT